MSLGLTPLNAARRLAVAKRRLRHVAASITSKLKLSMVTVLRVKTKRFAPQVHVCVMREILNAQPPSTLLTSFTLSRRIISCSTA